MGIFCMFGVCVWIFFIDEVIFSCVYGVVVLSGIGGLMVFVMLFVMIFDFID